MKSRRLIPSPSPSGAMVPAKPSAQEGVIHVRFGQKQTDAVQNGVSAITPIATEKADIRQTVLRPSTVSLPDLRGPYCDHSALKQPHRCFRAFSKSWKVLCRSVHQRHVWP